MPRMKPPKGYYTMSEAKRILDISDAMVRRYANKGKIRYLVPEGREQGFYNKQDVDKLSITINAFMTIDESEEEIEFIAASERDLFGIAKVANPLFASEKSENPTVPKWRYSILKKNPETQFALKVGDSIVGFTTILPFKVDTNKVEKLFISETVSEANITEEDIETFDPGKHIHIYIAGIGVDKNIESNKRKHYGARIVSGLVSTIVDLGNRGVVIENISAQGATIAGVHLLLNFGLHEIPAIKPGKRIFTMNVQESGSPMIMRYKKALEENLRTKQT